MRSLAPVALTLALAGCVAPSAPPVALTRPDLVIVTMDTTRADRLGCYGYEKAHTAAIDQLAARGIRYERVISPIPLTIPAHAAIMTGRYPAALGIRDNGGARLSQDAVTLAEILRGEGYATAASVAAFVTTRTWGFDQGFDTYLDEIPSSGGDFWHASARGEVVVDRALTWVEAHHKDSSPIFLWVHLYDPHFPYTPPERYAAAAEGRPYDGEIAYLDDQIGRIVEAFTDRHAVIALVGDHGEGLGDHGELTHGLFTYQATQGVPLIIAGEGVTPGVVRETVSLVDLAPALLHHLGLKAPGGLDGRYPHETRPLYAESWQLATRFGLAPHRTVVEGALKLVDTPRPELYDFVQDPGETKDLADVMPAEVLRLRAALDQFGFGPPAPSGKMEPEVAQQLQALGYVEGVFSGDLEGPLPDPKDHTELIRLTQRVDRQTQLRKPSVSLEALEALERMYPQILEFPMRKSAALAQLERHDEAVAAARRAVSLSPGHAQARMVLAVRLAAAAQFDEASTLFSGLVHELAYVPGVRVMAFRAMAASSTGQEEAIHVALEWLAANPEDHALAGAIGLALLDQRDPQRARPLLERGVQAKPPALGVAFGLAVVTSLDRPDEIRALLELEVQHNPEHPGAIAKLNAIYSKNKEWNAMVALYRRAYDANPAEPRWAHGLAQSHFNLGELGPARAIVDSALQTSLNHGALVLLDANLLAKEGKREAAEARNEQAQRLIAAQKKK